MVCNPLIVAGMNPINNYFKDNGYTFRGNYPAFLLSPLAVNETKLFGVCALCVHASVQICPGHNLYIYALIFRIIWQSCSP